MAKPAAGGRRPKRRERKNIAYGTAHIKSSFNNTIITFTDQSGNTIAWASAGNVGFKGSRKSTPFAAQLAAETAARRAMEHGVRKVDAVANSEKGITGENLLRALELRLDNVVFRASFASSRNQSRQFVRHGHVLVNGKRVTIPSYQLKKGDVVEMSAKAQKMIVL